ncbi:hypothetical protein FNJ84_18995 [Paracoccus sp. M683]|uniref:ATP-grasp domain-containing protein n=1 Tax=Paracoccus sp. M683 TaxID=2594268 RepID=UPI00117E9EEF|nr:ATP-grasp domain-containing protein [Paracoccus sp. M683]TRW94583.1 hypothetical protein FNJ84_18995 [Paracoccus sp. M683]
MDLCEWDAKALLRACGVAVPDSRLLEYGGGPVRDVAPSDIVKAQTLFGARGKAGLVRPAGAKAASTAGTIAARLKDRGLLPVMMIEAPVDISDELYLSIMLDDVAGAPRLMFSASGGMNVEDGAILHSLPLPVEGICPVHELARFFIAAQAPPATIPRLAQLGADLQRMFRNEDMTMIEINPLAVTPQGRLVALDCKASVDDSAAYRHRDRVFALSRRLAAHGRSTAEREAQDGGYTLVQSPGDVVVLSAGAGLGMMIADLLDDAGFAAASFFDNASGARGDTADARLDMAWNLARADGIRAIAFYQALASRDLAPRVISLLARLRADPPSKPFYFGLCASAAAEKTMTAETARQLIAEAGYPSFEFAEDMVAQMRFDRDAGLI